MKKGTTVMRTMLIPVCIQGRFSRNYRMSSTLFFYLSKETIALSKNMLQRWQSTIVPPKLPLRKVAKIDNSNFLAMSTLKCLVFLRPH